ncbi:CARDB domain-containing protein [Archangium lipolyticum]|uniref:CARDB domain-containing protein n=1 Tax=Archangium lipolyticum TaxID=2970465 RepID=UPI002149AA22|nr:CARDB domain-containing protein [Archangium lipolyticum]
MRRAARASAVIGALALMATACGKPGAQQDEARGVAGQALESGPDFVVTVVSGPASARLGQPIIASVTVCNQGTQPDSTEVELYLSSDAVITPPVPPAPSDDMPLGRVVTDYLQPGQCQTLSQEVHAMAPSHGAWYLGAVADPDNQRPETLEDNNNRVGNRIGIGDEADFVVKAVNGPASARSGQSFTASVTVCNQGTRPDSTDVELYLSSDTVITPQETPPPSGDLPLGRVSTGYLHPEQCQTLSLPGPISTPSNGVWYLGAVADPDSQRTELFEDNNTGVSGRIGIGDAADFVVTAVKGPASTRTWEPFTTSVTVCNQGTQTDYTEVELYLSSDAVITPPVPPTPSDDQPLGRVSTGDLYPGQCQTLSLETSTSSDGTWYLGAVADPDSQRTELFEDNNTRAGDRIGMGDKPDFVVTAVTAPPSARRWDSFTASVTVCNQGTRIDYTEVELYLSSDDILSPRTPSSPPGDRFVGGEYTGDLFPGQCRVLSIPVSASLPTDGTYYLGAVVDPMNNRPEFIEDNNTRVGSRIGIGDKPDFVVSAITAPPSTQPWGSFTTSVTVCNQGTQEASTEVELYLSSDASLSPRTPHSPPGDMPVGGDYTDYLVPGQCQTLSIPIQTSVPTDGVYYLGAVVDPMNNRLELIEDNNIRVGSRIGFGNKPDFVVSEVTGPTSTRRWDSFTASVTVCNQGTQESSTEVELYLSSDDILTPRTPYSPPVDRFVGGESTQYLFPGQCQVLSIPVSASLPTDGTYYLGAVVDPMDNRPEFFEDNNTRVGGRIGLGERPDFVVSEVTGPASSLPWDSFTASVTVCNQGTQESSTEVELYLSSDDILTPRTPYSPPVDMPVGGDHTDYLAPGECQTLFIPVSPWVPMEGPYYLGAVVDPMNNRPEFIEDNNTRVGSRIGIGERPDFVVSEVTGPTSALQGDSIDISVTVCNQGTYESSTEVELYLSPDDVITPRTPYWPSGDRPVGGMPTDNLYPGQCQTLTIPIQASVPMDGAYYLGAAVDPMNNRPEFIEDNNTRVDSRIGIGERPDFVVSTVKGPASARNGNSINVSVTVCNQGTYESSTEVELYLSSDAIINPRTPYSPIGDRPVGGTWTQSIAPGQCQTLSIPAQASVPMDGAYYLGAAVDPMNNRLEFIEDNNIRVGSRIGIGERPDFVVSTVAAPTRLRLSQQFTASVKVCNQGTQGASTVVELYLSPDAVITPRTPYGPSPEQPLGTVPSAFLNPGQCQTLSLGVQASAPYTGAWYLGAAADPDDSRTEFFEDNNTRASAVISITP